MKAVTQGSAMRVDSGHRRGPVLVLALAAVLLHAALLSGLTWLWPQPAPQPVRTAQPAIETRTLALLVPTIPAPPTVVMAEAPPPRAPERRPVVARPASGKPIAAQTTAFPAAEAAVARVELPRYRTLIPPPTQLRYRVQRGSAQGSAELRWEVESDAYEARLDIVIDGRTVMSQASHGGFDAAGLAPRRFTDQRRRGGTQAANFERELAQVVFSGPSHRYAIEPGAQDRLSWMFQLAAVAAAEPQRSLPGGEVAMFVVGARGDGRAWLFRCAGFEPVDAGGATIDAVKWVREPVERYDTRIEVWLAPARHQLPVRVRSGTTSDAPVWELLLEE